MKNSFAGYNAALFLGVLAQLVERYVDIVEVSGSSPLHPSLSIQYYLPTLSSLSESLSDVRIFAPPPACDVVVDL